MASKAVRDRKNRRDTSGSFTEFMTGAMVSVRTFNGETRMVDVKGFCPSTAAFAGKVDEELHTELPEGE